MIVVEGLIKPLGYQKKKKKEKKKNWCFTSTLTKADSEPSQTSKIELFAKYVISWHMPIKERVWAERVLLAAPDRRLYSKCKFQLHNKHKSGWIKEKVNRSKNMKGIW